MTEIGDKMTEFRFVVAYRKSDKTTEEEHRGA